MLFTSTRNRDLSVPFSKAVHQCLPEDGGVYIPRSDNIEDLRRWIYYIDENTTFTSIAGTLTSAFIQDEFSPIICETIATSAFPFSPKVRQLDNNLFMLELYHGYTGCYRDFGVSYLCSFLEATHELNGGNSIFLDFSHGELGALLSKVLRGKKNLKAVLVYPEGTVKGIASEDLYWNGGNIFPIEMKGSEDEIKEAIRKIYEDKAFVSEKKFTLANTTNVCRIFAHIFHYPYSFAQIKNKTDGDIYYAMDAGTYAPLIAGLYSWRYALPLNGFYLPSTASLFCDPLGNPKVSDSMVELNQRGSINPVRPANMERLESFFDSYRIMLNSFVHPTDISERSRECAAKELFRKYGVFTDPETAAAYASIKENPYADFGVDNDAAYVVVAQNHPSLNSDYCRHVIGEVPEMPENIKESIKPVKLDRPVISNVDELKKILQSL